jgi:hypothetical protein
LRKVSDIAVECNTSIWVSASTAALWAISSAMPRNLNPYGQVMKLPVRCTGANRQAVRGGGHLFEISSTPERRKDLNWVFVLQHQRTVNQDNTIALENRILQIESTRWRDTLAGCRVTVYEFPDGRLAVRYGPHEVARFDPVPLALPPVRRRRAYGSCL